MEGDEESEVEKEEESDTMSQHETDSHSEYSSDAENLYTLELRIWCTRANLVLYDATSWLFTKSYCLRWLSTNEAEPLVMILKASDDDIAHGSPSVLHQPEIGRATFVGPLVPSRAVELFALNLCPSWMDFHSKDQIGSGATCNVRLCTYINDRNDYAVKIIKMIKDDKVQIEPREVTILSDLRSKFVVQFSQAWVESHICLEWEDPSSSDEQENSADELIDRESSTYIFIQMEYCPRTLQDYLSLKSRKYDPGESFKYFEEMTKGIKYVHEEGVIHRDVKPANLFIGSDGVIKVGDFGQSCFRPIDSLTFKATSNLGTYFYEAPELEDGENISEKVDIHPLGVIYFELFNCFTDTMLEKHRALTALKESSSPNDWGSSTWKGDPSLCLQLLAEDPLKRPSPDDILESLYKVMEDS